MNAEGSNRKITILTAEHILKKLILITLALSANFCVAQIQSFYVKPILTDAGYNPTEDSSVISVNLSSPQNKLFLFIGGTGSSSSSDYTALRLHSANLGFHFINLSYPNNVAAASLANSSDSMTFNKYRQEVCFGTPLSVDVTVDSLNSIYTRTLKLIQYLALTYPTQNWAQYLASPSTLNWSKILVGGHSQGSGHACYLAKYFFVERVLMFSGPNDYSDFFSRSANWLRQSGVTLMGRHFAYHSSNDEVVSYSKQFANISGLGMLVGDDTTHVDDLTAPYGNSRCLYTTQPPGIVILNHNVPIKLTTINNGVWTYMLTSTITAGMKNNEMGTSIEFFPNPSMDNVFLLSEATISDLNYSIYDLSGQLIKKDIMIPFNKKYCIDISSLSPGIYFLYWNGQKKKIVKH